MSRNLWLYRPAIGHGSGEFILLVNSGVRNSCRRYDAFNGVKISEQSSPGLNYETAFPQVLSECEELEGLPHAKVSEVTKGLPLDYLAELQSQAGLPPICEQTLIAGRSIRTEGMLGGVEDIVDRVLGMKHKGKKAAIFLSAMPPELDCKTLIEHIYRRIDANWDGSPCRSKELWRWRAMTEISEQNMSPEKGLEKAIVNASNTWVNQIPAASGLLRGYEERHTNIDLGHRVGPGHYELIELKAGANAETPLRAAFQIVNYGLLYCFARLRRGDLELPSSPLLNATALSLKVLGPTAIYQGYCLGWLGNALDTALRQFSESKFGKELEIRFSFESFPAEFIWPGSDDHELRIMLERRMVHDFT